MKSRGVRLTICHFYCRVHISKIALAGNRALVVQLVYELLVGMRAAEIRCGPSLISRKVTFLKSGFGRSCATACSRGVRNGASDSFSSEGLDVVGKDRLHAVLQEAAISPTLGISTGYGRRDGSVSICVS